MSDGATHPAFTRRLVLYEGGLLSDDESNAMTEHLESCEACADYARSAIAAATREDAGHISPAFLARWPETSRTLAGASRVLVRHHLTRCEACRRELETLGFVPAVPEVPELEPDRETWARLEAMRDRVALAAAGGAGARSKNDTVGARASLLLDKLRAGLDALVPRPSVRFIPTLTLHGVRDATPTRITVEPGATAIALPLATPPLAPTSEVHVEVESPDGTSIYSEVHAAREISPPNVLLLSSDAPFPEGVYRVRLTTPDDAAPSEYRFDLRYTSTT